MPVATGYSFLNVKIVHPYQNCQKCENIRNNKKKIGGWKMIKYEHVKDDKPN